MTCVNCGQLGLFSNESNLCESCRQLDVLREEYMLSLLSNLKKLNPIELNRVKTFIGKEL